MSVVWDGGPSCFDVFTWEGGTMVRSTREHDENACDHCGTGSDTLRADCWRRWTPEGDLRESESRASVIASGSRSRPSMTPTDLTALAGQSLDAFWDVVVCRFPQARTGDLSPSMTIRLETTARQAIEEWVENNVPPQHHGNAA